MTRTETKVGNKLVDFITGRCHTKKLDKSSWPTHSIKTAVLDRAHRHGGHRERSSSLQIRFYRKVPSLSASFAARTEKTS